MENWPVDSDVIEKVTRRSSQYYATRAPSGLVSHNCRKSRERIRHDRAVSQTVPPPVQAPATYTQTLASRKHKC